MADGHKVHFEWPHSEPTEVIVAGSFNDWARTCHLTKEPTGFTGSIYVPWGSKITYKYIVDGTWTTHPDQPIEPDHDGNINNMYIAPPQPENEPKGNDNPAPSDNIGSLPQFAAHLADTVVAREGTSSALEYVASGFGVALNTVVGVDPVNPEQIAIPTPIQTAAITETKFDVLSSAVSDGAPLPSIPVLPPLHSVSENPANDEGLEAVPIPKVASGILVPIVPVNAAENNTSSIAAAQLVIAEGDVRDASRGREDEQPEKSTHIIVKVNEDVPVIVEDKTNKAAEIPMTVEEPHAAIEKSPAADSVLADQEFTSKDIHIPVAAAVDEPSLVALAERASMPEAPSQDPRLLKTLVATTPDLNPSSVLVSEKIPTSVVPSAIPEVRSTSQDIPVIHVERLQKELDELDLTKPESVVGEVKVEPGSISAPELSLEMFNVASGPAAAENAPELAREPEANRAKEETVPVGPTPFAKQILVSQTPRKVVEAGTEPSVEFVSAKQEENVPEAGADAKRGDSTSAPIQNAVPVSESQSASVTTGETAPIEPTLASMVEAAPTDQVTTLVTKATLTEPMTVYAAEARPAELSASTTEHAPAPMTQVTPTDLVPTSGIEAIALTTPKTEASLTETSPEPKTESNLVPPLPEPVMATFTPGHAKDAVHPVSVSPAPAQAAFPSTASPTASPSKSEKVTRARKKKSSILGRIKNFFESDKDKTKK
ncbi:hypothetical protein J132_11185 [Termitomyces sp. J132]|nr:hypothetical protein H2248_006012 [Termitomyces sp. 'cryptogamus']KNZ79189.1 hypothetical protein J132_11185 [Termitomyces sp. J132]